MDVVTICCWNECAGLKLKHITLCVFLNLVKAGCSGNGCSSTQIK